MKNKIRNSRLSHRIKKIERSQLKQMRKIGISNFESFSDVHTRQQEMFRRFDANDIDTEDFDELRLCEPEYCARTGCNAGCHFGTRKLRFKEILLAYEFFSQLNEPLYMATIVHPLWQRPLGDLSKINIKAARQWNYRRLHSLGPNVFAKGIFEVSLNHELDGSYHWAGQIHQIVSGASEKAFDEAFALEPSYHQENAKPVDVEPVGNLGYQQGYCLKRLGQERRAYKSSKTGRQNRRKLPFQKAVHWIEHDLWLLTLPGSARIITHGFRTKRDDEKDFENF